MSFAWGKFSPKAIDFVLNSNARINVAVGAVRSSKTINTILRWIEYTQTAPPGELLMIGKTERTLKRNVLDPIQSMIGTEAYKYNRGEGEVTIGDRRIYVVGANDESSVGRIQGLTAAGALGDEVTLWPENFWAMLLSRLSVPGAKGFFTLNPDHPFHWFKTSYLDRASELNMKVWHFVLGDNPNLDPQYVEDLKKEYVGLWFKRYILGLWVLAEGAIYDMWQDDLEGNLFDDSDMPTGLLSTAVRYIVVDYGTTNPMVFGDVYDNGINCWQYDEYYWDSAKTGRQKTDSQYADDLVEFVARNPLNDPVYVVLDPSAASFRAELRQRGISVRDADNDVLDGIRVTSSAIQNRIYRVHADNCPNLRREINGYVWDPKAKFRGVEQPIKINDHAVDMMRYFIKTTIRPWRLLVDAA